MEDYEIVSQQHIGDFVEKYDTQVSKAVAQLLSEHVLIDSTLIVVDRYKTDYHVNIMLDYTLPNSDVKSIYETLGDTYWVITSSVHVAGYMVKIWDGEIHKYFDK